MKNHARLLDDYTQVPAALVLYSPDDLGAIGGGNGALSRIMSIAEALAYRDADFDFAIAQNRYFDAPAWPQRRLLIVPEKVKLLGAWAGAPQPFSVESGSRSFWLRDPSVTLRMTHRLVLDPAPPIGGAAPRHAGSRLKPACQMSRPGDAIPRRISAIA